MNNEKIQLRIKNMHCATCVMHIEENLKKLMGVHEANVNIATNMATLEFDLDIISIEKIIERIKKTGYDALQHELQDRKDENEIHNTHEFDRQKKRYRQSSSHHIPFTLINRNTLTSDH